MVCNSLDYWALEFCPSFGILKNTTFRKLDLFPSSGVGVGFLHLINRIGVSHPLTWGPKLLHFSKRCVL
jgi:hypothetical protein